MDRSTQNRRAEYMSTLNDLQSKSRALSSYDGISQDKSQQPSIAYSSQSENSSSDSEQVPQQNLDKIPIRDEKMDVSD